MIKLCAALAPILLAAGCATSSTGAGTSSVSASAAAPATFTYSTEAAPTPKPPTNAEVCGRVQTYMVGVVKPTFNSWNVDLNEFNQRVGGALRREATHMYRLSADASGAVTNAIQHEAAALTDISIAIAERDDSQLGDASNRGNSALAELRVTSAGVVCEPVSA